MVMIEGTVVSFPVDISDFEKWHLAVAIFLFPEK